jgi:hypothetical protein
MGSSDASSQPRALAEAVAQLDGAVDQLSADLIRLDGAVSRMAVLAERWDRVALQLDLHDPALGDQARKLAATIRAGCNRSSTWAEAPGEVVARAGRLADDLHD